MLPRRRRRQRRPRRLRPSRRPWHRCRRSPARSSSLPASPSRSTCSRSPAGPPRAGTRARPRGSGSSSCWSSGSSAVVAEPGASAVRFRPGYLSGRDPAWHNWGATASVALLRRVRAAGCRPGGARHDAAGQRPRPGLDADRLHGRRRRLDDHARQPRRRADAAHRRRQPSWGATTGTPIRPTAGRTATSAAPSAARWTDRVVTCTVEAFYPDPLNRWYHVEAVPVDDGLHFYFTDVTERRVAQDRLAMLESVGAELGGTLDLDAAVARIPRLVVPRLADGCLLTVIDPDGRPRDVGQLARRPRAAAAHRALRGGAAGEPAPRRAAAAGAAGRRDDLLLRRPGAGVAARGRGPPDLPRRGHRSRRDAAAPGARAGGRRPDAAHAPAATAERGGPGHRAPGGRPHRSGAGQRPAVRRAAPARRGPAAQPAHAHRCSPTTPTSSSATRRPPRPRASAATGTTPSSSRAGPRCWSSATSPGTTPRPPR